MRYLNASACNSPGQIGSYFPLIRYVLLCWRIINWSAIMCTHCSSASSYYFHWRFLIAGYIGWRCRNEAHKSICRAREEIAGLLRKTLLMSDVYLTMWSFFWSLFIFLKYLIAATRKECSLTIAFLCVETSPIKITIKVVLCPP